MKNYLSYGVGAIGSICIHGLVLSVLLIPGDGDTQAIVIQPQYINSKLVELAPKKKVVVPKKTKSDAAKKKRERQRRLDAAKAKANADAQKKKKADLDRKEKERLALEQDRLERERLAELQRQKLAAEFAQTLAEEQLLLRAQEDEVAANSYRQLISLRLSENWSRPPSARRGMETLIRLQLVPTGRVVGVTVLK